MNKYSDFMKQIPADIIHNVDYRLCNDVALFKPQVYITGTEMYSADYHIIIPSVCPPDTYVNGRLVYLSSGKIITFNPGDSILCKKHQPTKQYLSLLIKPELMGRIAQEMDFSGEVRFLSVQHPFSRELLYAIQLFDKETMRDDNIALMLDCMATQIVVMILREFKTNLKKYPAHAPGANYVKSAIDYMREYYSANITINDICSEINISPYHFIRVFREKTGFSPHQYLKSIRMEKAVELLRSRQFSVAETARLCGFINVSHFSKAFKDTTGKSPKDYYLGMPHN